MTAHPEVEVRKRSLKQAAGGWLYRVATLTGWRRWAALIAAALLFVLAALYLAGSTDYREDPSALVPPSADSYAETRSLPELLKTAGAWRLWHPDWRGTAGGEQRSALERELAGIVSAGIPGLPVNQPLRWLSAASGAAWCVSRDAAGAESWALYLRLGDAGAALGEIEVEPGMALETVRGARGGDGVFSVAGGGVAFGVVGPWLILSGDAKLPEFAMEAKRRPSLSLAGSRIVPPWRSSAGVRGVFNPSVASMPGQPFGPSFMEGKLLPEARVAYTAALGRSGGVEAQINTVELSGTAPGGGVWALFLIFMAALAAASLCVIFAILLVMVGWGGWFKAMAARAGVAAAKEPEQVEASPAFQEDAGMEQSDFGIIKQCNKGEPEEEGAPGKNKDNDMAGPGD